MLSLVRPATELIRLAQVSGFMLPIYTMPDGEEILEDRNSRELFVEFVPQYWHQLYASSTKHHQLILPRLAAPLPLPAWFARCIMGELPMNELSRIELER